MNLYFEIKINSEEETTLTICNKHFIKTPALTQSQMNLGQILGNVYTTHEINRIVLLLIPHNISTQL